MERPRSDCVEDGLMCQSLGEFNRSLQHHLISRYNETPSLLLRRTIEFTPTFRRWSQLIK